MPVFETGNYALPPESIICLREIVFRVKTHCIMKGKFKMVNNPTNINKANNYRTSQTIEHKKRPWHMAFETLA